MSSKATTPGSPHTAPTPTAGTTPPAQRPAETPSSSPAARSSAAQAPSTAKSSFAASPKTTTNGQNSAIPNGAFVNCLPYFRKSETDLAFGGDDFHGSDGPIPVRRYNKDDVLPTAKAFWNACLALGFPETLDQNHPESTGVGPRPINNVDGVRMSASLTYLSQVRHRLNLTIRGDVLVHRILFDGKRAIGVQAQSGGETFSVYADQIILSGGAINSPQTLMLSGIGPAAHLQEIGIDVLHNLPGVGENLRDHPSAFIPFRTAVEIADVFAPSIQVGMRYTTPNSPHRNDMQMSPILMTSEHRPANVDLDEEGTYTGFSVALQKAVTAGTLRLASADPAQQPVLNYNYLSDPFDRERMRGAIRLCIEIAKSPEYEGILLECLTPSDEELRDDHALDRWLMANVGTQHHSSGTCKMGEASDPTAVVDQYCRVHGIDGLRVIDASIMPDVVRANTNATTIMIAERAADWLLNE